ncbi:hypothetical protein ACFE04_019642 [Oxalis oulophora]
MNSKIVGSPDSAYANEEVGAIFSSREQALPSQSRRCCALECASDSGNPLNANKSPVFAAIKTAWYSIYRRKRDFFSKAYKAAAYSAETQKQREALANQTSLIYAFLKRNMTVKYC